MRRQLRSELKTTNLPIVAQFPQVQAPDVRDTPQAREIRHQENTHETISLVHRNHT
jgi:hypothetical protein